MGFAAVTALFWSTVAAAIVPANPTLDEQHRRFVACVQVHMQPVTPRGSSRRILRRQIAEMHERAFRACEHLEPEPSFEGHAGIAVATGSPVDVIVG